MKDREDGQGTPINADDVAFDSPYNVDDSLSHLQECMNELSDWLLSHSSSFNVPKCADVTFNV